MTTTTRRTINKNDFFVNYEKKTDTRKAVSSGINLTCDLPIIRVSADHGIAFKKSGEGRANPESMIQAIQIVAQLAAQ